MSSASSLPAVLDAVLALAASALPGVQVIEGEIGTYVAAEQFQVVDVQFSETPANLGQPLRYDEDFAVNCLLRTYAGDDRMTDRRARALAMLDALRVAVDADPSLGGIVLRAQVAATGTLRTGTTDKGGSASEVDLTIHVRNQTG